MNEVPELDTLQAEARDVLTSAVSADGKANRIGEILDLAYRRGIVDASTRIRTMISELIRS